MSPRWDTSCYDWEDRILNHRSLIPPLPLFKDEANRALRIFKRLRIPDIEDTPRNGDVCAQWVFDLVEVLFGCYDPVLKRRMIREFFLLVPKKNGKSSISAAIMVTAAIMNRIPGSELLLIAPTKKIADIAYKQAVGIIRLDPELVKIFFHQQHQRTITHRLPENGATILIKAAETDVITGGKAAFSLVDESHVFAKRSNAADVFVEIRGALASRPDGFLLQITTQSKDRPAGVFKTDLNTARAVRDGEIQLPLLPILYELPLSVSQDGGWKDESNWPLVNPNLDKSVDREFLRDELLKAERDGPAALALYASQHHNVEIGQGLRTDGWVGAEFWEKQAKKELKSLDYVLERSDAVVVGADGGGLDDLFGLAVLGRDKETKDWLLWSHAWAHCGVLERRKSIASNLRDYHKDGDLTIVDDKLQDLAGITEIIKKIDDLGLLVGVALDPAAIGEFVDALADIDLTQANKKVFPVRQGYAMMNSIKTAERKLANGTLWHGGSPMMAWAVFNLKIELLATSIRATKANAGDAKIDPVMALFDAVMFLIENPDATSMEVTYEPNQLFLA